jgi:hypothetical protein
MARGNKDASNMRFLEYYTKCDEDAGIENSEILLAYGKDESPEDFIERYAVKYDLDRISM